MDEQGKFIKILEEAQCARQGKSCKGATMYVTYVPCEPCAKLIIQAGLEKVYAKQIRYTEGFDLLTLSGVTVLDWEQKAFNKHTIKT